MKKLAIVDFDGTLFPGNSMPYIWKRYGELGYSRVRYVKAAVKIWRDKTLYRKFLKNEEQWRYLATIHMFNLFEGMKDSEIRAFFGQISEDIYKDLNKDLLEQVKVHQKEGFEVVLLSGGFQTLLEMVGVKMGADRVKATPFVYNLEGRFTKVTKKDPLITMCGQKKKHYLEAIYYKADVAWGESYAYADNITDSDMMGMVGHPVAVNPDEDLKKCCHEKSWAIMA